MRSGTRARRFLAAEVGLLRAAARPWPDVPAWPDLTDPTPAGDSWMIWLRAVWANEDIVEAVQHASPELGRQVSALCAADRPDRRDVRRAVLSTARYLRRMAGRATPFGLMAGVAPVSFGHVPQHRWDGQHRPVARPSAQWLAQVLDCLHEDADLLGRVPVVANTTLTVRGSRLTVPYQPQSRPRGTGVVEISLRNTAAVRFALEAARSPVRLSVLADKVRAEFPTAAAATVAGMLTSLVKQGALITTLHAPCTRPDALGHLLDELDAAGGATAGPMVDRVQGLRAVHALLERHNQAVPGEACQIRAEVAVQMRRLAAVERHPLALDLRLDTVTVLPHTVARDIELAADLLTRLTPFPVGAPAWRSYHQRFYERYGIGSFPRLLDVVGDSGIGWPDGYPSTVNPELRSPLSRRDEVLLVLAQRAALDRRSEVVLDEAVIETLALGTQPLRPPPHLEIGVRVHARDLHALAQGDYHLEIVNVSRAAGALIGRFLSILEPPDAATLSACLSAVPTADSDTVAAQLSFPPLDPATAHVTRTPHIRPLLISLAESRAGSQDVLTPADLAVGCDGRRLYLAAPERGCRIEAAAAHALNLRTHTPPLARFLTELSRAQCAQVTTFDWGAARGLPFLPRLRYGRVILCPAQWRLDATDLPGRAEAFAVWDEALTRWRTQRHTPRLVYLTEGDQRLLLDLDQPGHRVLLRAHLHKARHAVLTEAPDRDDLGWCDGRPHEVIVPVMATEPAAWPPLPAPTVARIIDRDHHQTPGASTVLLACLYSDLHRQDILLTEHLPGLLARLGQPPWWFIRYRDPDHHLRLRIALPDADAFGPSAATVSAWADELRRQGLLRELAYRTSYPEIGRWGEGQAWTAAEDVFRTDSAAVLAQLRRPDRPHRQALVAVHSVAIATAFTGSADAAMRWLLDHVAAAAPTPVPRPVFTAAVTLADPRHSWAALRATPGGETIAHAWAARDNAVAAYRKRLDGPGGTGIVADDVLGSLLHAHFVRACGIDFDDEAVGLYLARCAALAWQARTTGGTP
jgi:thiopeptide-type bacteriocin biosynthesis protein